MAFDWRKLAKDKRAWVVAAIGGAGGVALAVRAKRQGSGGAAPLNDGAIGPYTSMQPSVYDSSLQDIWEGFNQTALDLQQQINEIGDQLNSNTPPSSPGTPAPTPGKRPHATLESLARKYKTTPATIARASRRYGIDLTRYGRKQPLPYGKLLYVAPGRPLRV